MIDHPEREEEPLVEISATIRRDTDGRYWAEVEQLPGCFASGGTVPELLEGLTEAVALYLAKRGEEPPPVPLFASIGMTVPA